MCNRFLNWKNFHRNFCDMDTLYNVQSFALWEILHFFQYFAFQYCAKNYTYFAKYNGITMRKGSKYSSIKLSIWQERTRERIKLSEEWFFECNIWKNWSNIEWSVQLSFSSSLIVRHFEIHTWFTFFIESYKEYNCKLPLHAKKKNCMKKVI